MYKESKNEMRVNKCGKWNASWRWKTTDEVDKNEKEGMWMESRVCRLWNSEYLRCETKVYDQIECEMRNVEEMLPDWSGGKHT